MPSVDRAPFHRPLVAALLSVLAGSAGAETSNVSPAGFDITIRRELRTGMAEAWPAIGRIGQWWTSQHSGSGDAANMTIELTAGGCFCERWSDAQGGNQSVEHGRVVAVRRSDKEALVRLQASLGPFQERPGAGVLSFVVAAADTGSTLTVSYRFRGGADAGLDRVAAGVDKVIEAQADRLARFIDTGKAE